MSGAAPDTEVIYLDNNATTRIAPEVLEAMMPFLTTEYYNPSSVYERAAPAANAVKAARKTIAQFLGGVSPHEIMFNSCATEGANTAILGAVKATGAEKVFVTHGEPFQSEEMARHLVEEIHAIND